MKVDDINLKMFASLHVINNGHLGEDFNLEVITSASLFLRLTVALETCNLPTRIIPYFSNPFLQSQKDQTRK